ncbi:uncharacterized protein STEHIDRAFT_47435 [Stereum hirsutum FP-91666 SS1]|uniref:uncharacterized protein n=1 Tax=Stereum hirsutum (strain FP-91666) TaxID=721885 RepID=UPI000440AB04|nr:uncharacterized protein STEHIDRAFT_47435 [Stereum hirsutum FP-91666 SS1]EIM92473.1 hypothetical protein STEHIDRAFT_47435 [Stereum hirsutum FP-91666 SS1]
MAGICFGANYSILHLDIVDIPSKPCLTCTKQWCINQNLAICAGASLGDTDPDTATGKEGDVEARCFQRDSPRDQLVVTIFLLVVFGLLLGAGIKGRMIKAGLNETSFGWDAGRKWWQVCLSSLLITSPTGTKGIMGRLSCLRDSSRTSISWVGLPMMVWGSV